MQVLNDNPALRSHLETQLDFMNEYSQKACDSLRQLSEMNLRLARQTIEGALHTSREMVACTDPMQLTQTAMKQIQPAVERLHAYQQHLLTWLAGAQAALTQAAETRFPEVRRSASAATDEILRHAVAAANVPVTGPSGAGDAPAPLTPSSGNGSAGATPHSS
jgi:phasin family protein